MSRTCRKAASRLATSESSEHQLTLHVRLHLHLSSTWLTKQQSASTSVSLLPFSISDHSSIYTCRVMSGLTQFVLKAYRGPNDERISKFTFSKSTRSSANSHISSRQPTTAKGRGYSSTQLAHLLLSRHQHQKQNKTMHGSPRVHFRGRALSHKYEACGLWLDEGRWRYSSNIMHHLGSAADFGYLPFKLHINFRFWSSSLQFTTPGHNITKETRMPLGERRRRQHFCP